MKNICKKAACVLEKVIDVALALCLFLGGLGFLGFAAAFCIGGDTASVICTFLSKTYYVWLIRFSTVTTVFCFVLQYLNGSAKWINPFKKKV